MGDELRGCGCNNELPSYDNNNCCCSNKFLFFILIFILLFIDR